MKVFLLAVLLFTAQAYAQTDLNHLTGKQDGASAGLLPQVQEAFYKMQQAALADGIELTIVSGYRSYNRQQKIWNRKYKKYAAQGLTPDAIFNKIVEYSTVPGTSRHHWGTDIDIIDSAASYSGDVLVPHKYHGSGPFCKMKEWMELNAATYGFELVYTYNERRTGFKYEPWHYSFKPAAVKLLRDYKAQVDLLVFLRSQDILGMDKISDARLNQYLLEHIDGVNSSLK